jgi:hypothetical protein
MRYQFNVLRDHHLPDDFAVLKVKGVGIVKTM